MKRSEWLGRAGAAALALLAWGMAPPGRGDEGGVTPASATTEQVTLSLENVEIVSTLKLLSQARRINIVAGPEVSGLISVNLYDVPFDQALQAILDISGYTAYEKDGVIYVTTETRKADLPLKAHDMETRTYKIDHVTVEAVLQTVTAFLSPSGKAVQSPGKLLVVQDAPAYLKAIERIIRDLDVPPLQVLITVKILTVTHNDDQSIGIDFSPSPATLDLTDVLTSGFAEDLRALPVGAAGLFAGGRIGEVEIFLEALADRAAVEILASPQLLVIDGQTASIQVGDRLGFRVTTVTDTSSLESVEFLEVGTTLEVTPQITSDGLVRLLIHPKVSNGIISSDGLPSENTTEAETDMLVEDGQTVVIGGLLNVSKQRIRSQVPLLGNIPLVGLFFGRNRWVDTKTEVIILITPHIHGPSPSPYMNERIAVVDERNETILEGSKMLSFKKEEKFRRKVKRESVIDPGWFEEDGS